MTNRPLLAAIAVTVLMQLAALYVPALNRVFTTEPLSTSSCSPASHYRRGVRRRRAREIPHSQGNSA
jgi:hypothetical protein